MTQNLLYQTYSVHTKELREEEKKMGKEEKQEFIEVMINQQISSIDYKGNITDGSHTFDELYYHRMVLFSVICNSNSDKAWKSWLHDDGTMFDDYFIVGIETPEGQFTYHYHKDAWEDFHVPIVELAPEWDGHTPEDITRLNSL